MYIAIEGVKGVGKSTLLERVEKHLSQQGIDYTLACPTRIGSRGDFYEFVYRYIPFLERLDFVKDFIYARRANQIGQTTQWNAPLVLGDRSIATSYITRLWENNNPEKHLKKIDSLQPLLPAPDYILYLKTDMGTVLSRISKRKPRWYGKNEEKPENISTDLSAYDYIMNNKAKTRLTKTEWIILDASKAEEDLFAETIELIESFIKSIR